MMTPLGKLPEKGGNEVKADTLRPSQVMSIVAIAAMGVDLLMVQNTMVSYAGRDAWISLLLGGFLGIFFGGFMYYLANLYPDKDLPQIFVEVAGKYIGRLLIIPLLIYVLFHTGLSIRIFAQTLLMFLLDRTPIFAIVILMVIVVVYTVYKGIYTLSGVIDIIFPFAIVTVTMLILLSFQQAEFDFIKPVLYNNYPKVLRGSFLGLVQFTGFGHITYVLCYAHGSKISWKWYVTGAGIPIVLYVALTIVTIMAFNPMGVISLTFPTLTLSKSIEFPVTFLERLESFVAMLWISIAFGSISLFTFSSVRNFVALFNIRNEKFVKLATVIHIPLLTIVALAVKSGLKVIEYYFKLNYVLAALTIVIFPAITIIAAFKKRREGKA